MLQLDQHRVARVTQHIITQQSRAAKGACHAHRARTYHVHGLRKAKRGHASEGAHLYVRSAVGRVTGH